MPSLAQEDVADLGVVLLRVMCAVGLDVRVGLAREISGRPDPLEILGDLQPGAVEGAGVPDEGPTR
jgi:hypothetical protein